MTIKYATYRRPAKNISLDDLKKFFSLPIAKAADALALSESSLKKICREYGVQRWPWRKINSVQNKITKMKKQLATIQKNDEPEALQETIKKQIKKLEKKKQNMIDHPQKLYGPHSGTKEQSFQPKQWVPTPQKPTYTTKVEIEKTPLKLEKVEEKRHTSKYQLKATPQKLNSTKKHRILGEGKKQRYDIDAKACMKQKIRETQTSTTQQGPIMMPPSQKMYYPTGHPMYYPRAPVSSSPVIGQVSAIQTRTEQKKQKKPSVTLRIPSTVGSYTTSSPLLSPNTVQKMSVDELLAPYSEQLTGMIALLKMKHPSHPKMKVTDYLKMNSMEF